MWHELRAIDGSPRVAQIAWLSVGSMQDGDMGLIGVALVEMCNWSVVMGMANGPVNRKFVLRLNTGHHMTGN